MMQVTDEMVRVALHEYVMGHHDTPEQAMRAALEAALAVMWRDIKEAPRDGRRILAIYGGQTRVVQYGKTSHVPLYGFCLADQGPEDFDLVPATEIKGWMPLPSPPQESRPLAGVAQ